MLDFSNILIEKISTHFVGNPIKDEPLLLSDNEFTPTKDLSRNLLNIFLPCFKNSNEEFEFTHPTEIELNPVLKYIRQISSKKGFSKPSQNIAKILYENSTHHNIKSSELIVVLFSNITFNDTAFSAVGLFKPESKQNFLNIKVIEKEYEYEIQEGITTKNIDKAALILTQKDSSEKVFLFNKFTTSEDSKFWKDDFLNLTITNNNYSETKNFIGLFKEYITKRYAEDFEVNKADQVDLLNRSIAYLKQHEEIKIENFTKQVFHHPSIIKSFDTFKDEYQSNNDITIENIIEVSPNAVKNGNRLIKSIIKLDKNFHIYIHGSRDLIEQGYDNKIGKKYYKIYFDSET